MHDLAEVILECLRHVAVGEVLTIGDKEVAVVRLHDTTAEVFSARSWAMLPINDFYVGEPWHLIVIKPGTCKRSAPPAIEWLSIRKVNCAVLCEIAVEDHVKQTPLSRGEHPRHISQRRGQLAIA